MSWSMNASRLWAGVDVEKCERGPCLDRSKERHERVEAALDRDRHDLLVPHTARSQVPCELGGPTVELRAGQLPPVAHRRDRIGCGGSGPCDDRVHWLLALHPRLAEARGE